MKRIRVNKRSLVEIGIGTAMAFASGVIFYKLGWNASFKHFSENALDVEEKIGDLVSQTIVERVKEYCPDSVDGIDKFKEVILRGHGFPSGSGKIDYINKVMKWSEDGIEWSIF